MKAVLLILAEKIVYINRYGPVSEWLYTQIFNKILMLRTACIDCVHCVYRLSVVTVHCVYWLHVLTACSLCALRVLTACSNCVHCVYWLSVVAPLHHSLECPEPPVQLVEGRGHDVALQGLEAHLAPNPFPYQFQQQGDGGVYQGWQLGTGGAAGTERGGGGSTVLLSVVQYLHFCILKWSRREKCSSSLV